MKAKIFSATSSRSRISKINGRMYKANGAAATNGHAKPKTDNAEIITITRQLANIEKLLEKLVDNTTVKRAAKKTKKTKKKDNIFDNGFFENELKDFLNNHVVNLARRPGSVYNNVLKLASALKWRSMVDLMASSWRDIIAIKGVGPRTFVYLWAALKRNNIVLRDEKLFHELYMHSADYESTKKYLQDEVEMRFDAKGNIYVTKRSDKNRFKLYADNMTVNIT